jgi:hypothetical protein
MISYFDFYIALNNNLTKLMTLKINFLLKLDKSESRDFIILYLAVP